MKKQHTWLVMLVIILLVIIGFILWRADNKIQEVDQQMPVIGSLDCRDFVVTRGPAKAARF